MKKTGASLIVHALEQIGVRYTFGIPGVHNTELYDELGKSEKIQPVLVTHESGGAFMADAISRTSSSVGTLVIVPAAGATHSLSGIAEAYLDGVPMLIISGGIRTDSGKAFQLHDIDQGKLVGGAVKKYIKISRHTEIIPSIYEAYNTAVSGEPGPVFVEVPVNIQLFADSVGSLPKYVPPKVEEKEPDRDAVRKAAELLCSAKSPGMFLGWGARNCTEITVKIASLLGMPASVTLQGLSAFPADSPFSVGMGFGNYSVPAAEKAFSGCDCLLAVGTRFSEIPTGSFGMKTPKNLIHIDINPNVFSRNYPASVTLEGRAESILPLLYEELIKIVPSPRNSDALQELIRREKAAYLKEWTDHKTEGRVNPARFFQELRKQLPRDGYLVADDGNHTFLSAELFPVYEPCHFISPTDFNCMGYAAPASIGVKIANPEKEVAAVIGDGAFLMTCMEILTASALQKGVVYYVFNDGELSQISQGQEIPYNRKTCTVLGNVKFQGIAAAVGAEYLRMETDEQIESVISTARQKAASGVPVIVDVNIDYSKRTRFTSGVVGTNLGRFPLREKIRFILRALKRKFLG
ncbi:MAG TPA: thiamine pyrophosphate-binding protein [Leptospiraceae bacterium]|nr:thiamine pyrophosphate-binding protein [Leptospiraceae bacterium]HNN06993.1 thiamine pyrophosphate-binding protein [Leptospiraceae bacterium]